MEQQVKLERECLAAVAIFSGTGLGEPKIEGSGASRSRKYWPAT